MNPRGGGALLKIPIPRYYSRSVKSDLVGWDLAFLLLVSLKASPGGFTVLPGLRTTGLDDLQMLS